MTWRITGDKVLWGSCVGLLMGAAALAWTPAVSGESTAPTPTVQQGEPAKIDRALPGMKKGIVSKAHDGAVWIDGKRYVLAPGALVEKKRGDAVLPLYLKFEGVNFNVEYWLGAEPGQPITQMVIDPRE
jgi:hypothetical protein